MTILLPHLEHSSVQTAYDYIHILCHVTFWSPAAATYTASSLWNGSPTLPASVVINLNCLAGGGKVSCVALQAAAGRLCAEDLPHAEGQCEEGDNAAAGSLHPCPQDGHHPQPAHSGADLLPVWIWRRPWHSRRYSNYLLGRHS